ncbi:GyrI-like domain-containing protein [Flavobacterium sp. XGLA_31]|uniref:GyrI-like domain-containing protein n=1 Tax=Flavobacterium sp. XGLA_31 TaxID=3447666 RepID=UPI003F2BCB77
MRILKYIFLLLLLALIGITVYVTTQKGSFAVSRSSIIKAQRSTVFDYINDYRNWETFGSWMTKDNTFTFEYAPKTIGAGGSFSWKNGSDFGSLRTYFVKENDSIAQKGHYNGTSSSLYWTFKDTIGGTKVTVHSKGEMDIFTKITTFFKGGMTSVLDDICEKSLRNLDKTLDYEMKTYTIKVNGISQRSSGYCLKQTVSCKIKSLSKNIKIMMPRMVHFFKKNKIAMAGKPFVLYERYDKANDFVTFSVNIPTVKQVFVMPGSDVESGEIMAFTCLKTTLIGDHSHTQEAWDKAKRYIADNGLKENVAGKYTEVYLKTIDDVKQPSKWITEIYIPVFPKAVVTTSPATPNLQTAVPITTPNTDSAKTP